MKKRKEEQYFKKEFAKDVKKMKDPPKEKADVFDKFADGDIDLDEFLEIMEQKKSKSRGQRNGTKKVNQTAILNSRSKQRLSHFFASKEDRGKECQKSAFLDLTVVLKDLDEQCDREEETKKVESTSQTKLTIEKTTTVVVSREVIQIDTTVR